MTKSHAAAVMESFRPHGATTQDRVALTRHILTLMWIKDAAHQKIAGSTFAGRLWTENSSGASLVSVARVLGTPDEIEDRLAWWAS